MFTVIIQSQETARLGADYRRLFFTDLTNSGAAAFCTWIKTGDTVETALPALYKLISGKKQWRAIVVLTEHDRNEAPASREDNPFDFLQNRGETVKVEESSIPLIRLTHILGGVPEPEVRFEPREIVDEETNKVARLIYEPVRDEAEQAEYQRLTEKYRLTENRPAEILLVATRQAVDHTADEVHAAWNMRLETQSSDFAYRNQYPNICRFIVFDVLNDRHSLYSGCIFRLWVMVQILAQNRITPSSLQAYRLYKGDVTLDRTALGELLDEYLDQLTSMTGQLDAEDAAKVPLSVEASKEAPDISETVRVVFRANQNNELFVSNSGLGFVRDLPEDERVRWHEQYKKALKALRELLRSPKRTLKVSADECRQKGVYPPERVQLLNEFQTSDLEETLEREYQKVLEARSELGFDVKNREKEHRLINQQVQTRIDQRLTQSRKSAGFGAVLGITAVSLIPALIYGIQKNGAGAALTWLLAAAAFLAVVLGFGMAELWIQRKEMADAMEDHNRVMLETLHKVEISAEHYSDYLTALCTYLRGQSYLERDHALRSGRENVTHIRRGHRTAIRHYSGVIQDWAAALELPMQPVHNADPMFSFDAECAPEECRAYVIEGRYPNRVVEMSGAGEKLDFPYGFVTTLNLKREELYNDANAHEST